MQTALASPSVRPVLLCDLQTPSSWIYLSTLPGALTWNFHTYTGGGILLGVPSIEDAGELRATGCDIPLNGANSGSLSLALSLSHSRTLTVYLGLFDTSGTLIVDPFILFFGKFDKATIDEDPTEPKVVLHYESEIMRLKRPGSFRYTDAIQQSLFPGDKGFQYAPVLEDWNGYWGKAIRIRSLKKKREK